MRRPPSNANVGFVGSLLPSSLGAGITASKEGVFQDLDPTLWVQAPHVRSSPFVRELRPSRPRSRHSPTNRPKLQRSEPGVKGRPLSRTTSSPRTSFDAASEWSLRSHRTATLLSSGIRASEMARQPPPCGGLSNSTGPAGTAS